MESIDSDADLKANVTNPLIFFFLALSERNNASRVREHTFYPRAIAIR